MKLTSEEKRIIVPAIIKLFRKRTGERQAIKGYDVIIQYLQGIIPKDHKVVLKERSIRKCISHIREYPQVYKIFIMANSNGFFVPKCKEEAQEFIKRWNAYMATMQRVHSGVVEYAKFLPSLNTELEFPKNEE